MSVDYARLHQLTTAEKLQLIGLLWRDIEDALRESPNPAEVFDEIDLHLSENPQEASNVTQRTKTQFSGDTNCG